MRFGVSNNSNQLDAPLNPDDFDSWFACSFVALNQDNINISEFIQHLIQGQFSLSQTVRSDFIWGGNHYVPVARLGVTPGIFAGLVNLETGMSMMFDRPNPVALLPQGRDEFFQIPICR